ncbi:hypothetical protein B6D60_06655 [candidate division KSB1 bacterium 4484_87]|nr:MAG: hypothetical protein B6D60_06655 [candidate division KSB1 bacterium 4484_87]
MARQIENLDEKCYREAVREQQFHQEDWLKVGYAPKGFYLKDFCIFKHGNVYHLFHIAGTPGVSCCLPGNELWFGHATTKNFRYWETHEPCLYIDTNGWDNGHVFAPYVIEFQGKFWMFYTGVSIKNRQRIGLAVSDDLYSWRRVSKNPIITPEKYPWAFCPDDRGSACRDPHICRFGDEFSLYYTAVTREGKGCVARASSADLLHWKDGGPVFMSDQLAHPESSNVQEFEGKYFLFFGGQYEFWSYVISDDPFDWKNRKPIPLKQGITAMEVIVRKGSLWLVAYFKMDNYRLFLGTIDWAEAKPTIREIMQEAELKEFFIN